MHHQADQMWPITTGIRRIHPSAALCPVTGLHLYKRTRLRIQIGCSIGKRGAPLALEELAESSDCTRKQSAPLYAEAHRLCGADSSIAWHVTWHAVACSKWCCAMVCGVTCGMLHISVSCASAHVAEAYTKGACVCVRGQCMCGASVHDVRA